MRVHTRARVQSVFKICNFQNNKLWKMLIASLTFLSLFIMQVSVCENGFTNSDTLWVYVCVCVNLSVRYQKCRNIEAESAAHAFLFIGCNVNSQSAKLWHANPKCEWMWIRMHIWYACILNEQSNELIYVYIDVYPSMLDDRSACHFSFLFFPFLWLSIRFLLCCRLLQHFT